MRHYAPRAMFWPLRFGSFLRCEHPAQTIGELRHRAFRFIGANVWNVRVFVAGSFFQHVCGNSEPVRAL